jgi:hypothetical protein
MGQIGQTANRVEGGDPAAAVGDPTLAAGRPSHARLEMLDGWRAISILTVLAGHMLPLGPRSWALNGPVAALGMAIFFTLSGFLVVSILLRDQNIIAFAIKRVARILPLAWAVLVVVLGLAQAGICGACRSRCNSISRSGSWWRLPAHGDCGWCLSRP